MAGIGLFVNHTYTYYVRDAMATGHDIAMGLRAAYLRMHRQTNAYLARCGITADQFVLLALLMGEDGITQRELVRRASSDANTVRAMLVLLENRGLVGRGPHPKDRRARVVTLTQGGREAFDGYVSAVRLLQDHLSGLFEDGEARVLVNSLERISQAMALPEHRRSPSRSAVCEVGRRSD